MTGRLLERGKQQYDKSRNQKIRHMIWQSIKKCIILIMINDLTNL